MGNINTQSSVQFIEYNKGNHTILNQIYDILAEFQNQGNHHIVKNSSTYRNQSNEDGDKQK